MFDYIPLQKSCKAKSFCWCVCLSTNVSALIYTIFYISALVWMMVLDLYDVLLVLYLTIGFINSVKWQVRKERLELLE